MEFIVIILHTLNSENGHSNFMKLKILCVTKTTEERENE